MCRHLDHSQNAASADEEMGRGRKYRLSDDAPPRQSSNVHGAADQIGMAETVRAVCGAVTALADTLNALGLRIALARNVDGPEDEPYAAYYNRLALLAESAAGQVRGIQKLLGAIEITTLRNNSARTKPPTRSRF